MPNVHDFAFTDKIKQNFFKCLLYYISKVVPYSITSIGLGADPGFLAVSPQVT